MYNYELVVFILLFVNSNIMKVMDNFFEWLQAIFIVTITGVARWFYTKVQSHEKDIKDIRKETASIKTTLALLADRGEATKEILEKIDNKLDKIDDRFSNFERDRLEFYKRYDLKKKQ